MKKLNYLGEKIRVVDFEEGLFVCIKDICDIVGIKNIHRAVKRMNKIKCKYVPFESGGQNRIYAMYPVSEITEFLGRSYKKESQKLKDFLIEKLDE
jgi:prophage antirepressor-like protein